MTAFFQVDVVKMAERDPDVCANANLDAVADDVVHVHVDVADDDVDVHVDDDDVDTADADDDDVDVDDDVAVDAGVDVNDQAANE